MKCPKCSFENNPGAAFCGSCGATLGTFCSNCGAANNPGARFCISCGNPIGAPAAPPLTQYGSLPVQPQPVVVMKGGMPGWAWAVIGILLGVVVIGGLALAGILPLDIGSAALTPPPLEPVMASPEVSTQEPYCPETGGVILYWNAGYDCLNDSGDLGFRQRVGDGMQDLNTGQFDNEASAIQIPPGWSVRLYENVEGNGASVCFNTSISNFEDRGNFPNGNLPINDNVSSMEVFADGTCGEDLAAGAKPAPLPEIDWPEPQPGIPGLEPAAPGCDSINPCNCMAWGLFMKFNDEGGSLENFEQYHRRFDENYVEDIYVENDKVVLELIDPDGMFDEFFKSGGQINVDTEDLSDRSSGEHFRLKNQKCEVSPTNPGHVVCSGSPAYIPGSGGLEFGIRLEIQDDRGVWTCSIPYVYRRSADLYQLAPGAPEPSCREDYTCPLGETCKWMNYSGKWLCVKSGGGSGGCSSGLSSSECGAAGGTWDSWANRCSCD